MKVTEQNVTETRSGNFVTDASDLGLPVGTFPTVLPTSLGNGLDFVAWNFTEDYIEYLQQYGSVKLTVFND